MEAGRKAMKHKIAIGSVLGIVMLLAATGTFRSQEVLPALAAPQEEEFLFSGGGAWLGVSLQDVTAEKARELKLAGDFGALVGRVEADSPASTAGLEKGDVIVEFAGERVRSVAQLRRLISETPAGRAVVLQVVRAGQSRTLHAKLEPRKERFFRMEGMAIPRIEVPKFDYRVFTRGATLGISGDELTSQLAEYFGVKQGKGVLVREVESGSAAEKAGLKAGDVVIRVDNTEVSSVESLRRALPRDFEGKRKVNLTIVRDRREQTLAAELEAPEEPLRSLEREATRLREQQARELALQMAERQVDLQKTVQQATRAWTQQYQRYLEEMHRSMGLLQRELQKQKLQELREKLPRTGVV
jgi:C-terminal processing protease CtpA/Prc